MYTRLHLRYFIMRAAQVIWILKRGILGHVKPLSHFRVNGLFKDNFLFEGWGRIPPFPPRCAK